MLASIAAAQPLLLAVVLAWAGGYKLTRRAAAAAAGSALARLLGTQRAALAYRAVGVVELATAALLLAPPAMPWEPWLGVTLAAGFLAYLGYARLTAPTSSCGCLSAGAGPIAWRHFARAGMLLLSAATAGALGHGHPITTVALGVFVAEAAIVLALSPELDRLLPRVYGRLKQRLLPNPLAATATLDQTPLHATLERLYDSPVYAANASLVRSDVQDYWDVGDWRILAFGGRAAETAAEESASMTVVFAVPARYGEDVRMSIVDGPGAPVPTLT